jgi:hypothetical protein
MGLHLLTCLLLIAQSQRPEDAAAEQQDNPPPLPGYIRSVQVLPAGGDEPIASTGRALFS